MDILKFITAGNVDDGKSTLIGRLLYDTGSILDDQLDAIQRANRKNDDGTIDLAILTDGLKAEREQGITIDVAYKYFQTSKRKFIIADTPGHLEYTRNMVTGASDAQLAIILIDARKGVTEQTIRHSFLVSLLKLTNIVVCVNKMDMVDYDYSVYLQIIKDYTALSERLKLDKVEFIPISALKGDNVAGYSDNMIWYTGSPLLDFLESVPVSPLRSSKSRMFVQYVIRPQTDAMHDYRGYAGRVSGGRFQVGDEVVILPSGQRTIISHIEFNEEDLKAAEHGASVIFRFTDDLDISRGDLIVPSKDIPNISRELNADLCWLSRDPLDLSKTYILQTASRTSQVKIREILHKVNIRTMDQIAGDAFGLNDIGKVRLKTANEWAYDPYVDNKTTGGGILIDRFTNLTVGAIMIEA